MLILATAFASSTAVGLTFHRKVFCVLVNIGVAFGVSLKIALCVFLCVVYEDQLLALVAAVIIFVYCFVFVLPPLLIYGTIVNIFQKRFRRWLWLNQPPSTT